MRNFVREQNAKVLRALERAIIALDEGNCSSLLESLWLEASHGPE